MPTQESPVIYLLIQGGFAGLSVLLIGIVLWLLKHLIRLTSVCARALEGNTDALVELRAQITQNGEAFKQIQAMLMTILR